MLGIRNSVEDILEANEKQTECYYNHELTPENTVLRAVGRKKLILRCCRQCEEDEKTMSVSQRVEGAKRRIAERG